MKRRLRVGIRSRKDSYTAALQALRQVETGKRTVQAPGSVTELARLVGRDLKNVSADLTILRQVGLIEFVETKGHENARTPVVPYDEIDITIDLHALAQSEAA